MHDKGGKLNQPLHTAGHTLSPSSCTHFSPSILKLSWHTAPPLLESFCWNIINSLTLHGWNYKSYKDKRLCFHIKIYMITSLLNMYYFISTTITTINQSYYIKHILYIYLTIIMILRLWF